MNLPKKDAVDHGMWAEIPEGGLLIKVMYREDKSNGFSGHTVIPKWRDRLLLRDLDNPDWIYDLVSELEAASYNWRN